MVSKCQKFRQWTAEEKYKIIKPALVYKESVVSVPISNN